ncbi:MAG: DUF1599 domain-containing protein [Bacteroidetes bacterium]|nr:DUF1599 domain-containing protein [Bacteroidota bacterium]HET6243670.1 DUF1599 domain-containing protein [Bacteroidia bacterium]
MSNTTAQYDFALNICKDIFINKMKDYASAWRILRTASITDQIFIKAQRIRNIEENGVQKVDEGIKPEYIGIVNYAIIGLIQLELGTSKDLDLPLNQAEVLYEKFANNAKSLMLNKNHDYGEAWRDMRINSLTDLILMKILRTKQIEDNKGTTIISEGIDANYYDMINYAIFALIKLEETKS